jgi:hypothetical protein
VNYPDYPPLSREASTFSDLFLAYSQTWPAATKGLDSAQARAYAGRLLRRARAVAAQLDGIHLWEQLEPALRDSMRWYDATKGPFEKFFKRNLCFYLDRAVAREARSRKRTRRRERRYAKDAAHRRGEHGKRDDAFIKWARYLLAVAMERLDPRGRAYLEMKQDGVAVKDMARKLGVSEKTLWNQYGGRKLSGLVKREVRSWLGEQTPQLQRQLVRHMLEEAELTVVQVEDLLGVAITVDEEVRLLKEDDLLRKLGRRQESSGGFGGRGNTLRDKRQR